MSRNNGKSPRLDLKLNLSPPARGGPSMVVAAMADDDDSSPNGSSSSTSLTSPPSSCVSSENEQGEGLKYDLMSSPEAASMVLAGCPRCLIYVMVSEEEPKCPMCKSAVLIDFLRDDGNSKKTKTKKS